ncbi:hypothetical protein GCM10009814_12020 [Lapillicoccus jejuensis]
MVVDVGRWYLTQQQAQRAADAAAMAGVTSLPGDPTTAYSKAATYAGYNGFTTGGGTTVTSAATGAGGNRLAVTVRTSVNNFFLPLFGINKTNIATTATADYVAPVQMGSPCNRIGLDPESPPSVAYPSCSTSTGRLWVNVNSPSTEKLQGDPYSVTNCGDTSSGTNRVADNCASLSGPNNEYTANGFFYELIVSKPGTLNVQLYDAPWVDTAVFCNSSAMNGLASALGSSDPRYSAGATNYCDGDAYTYPYLSNYYTAQEATTYTLRSNDGSTDPLSHSVVGGSCTKTYAGYEPASASQFASDITNNVNGLGDTFHKWSTLCSITATPGTYMLQVQSAQNVAGQGMTNHFSIRATSSAGNDAVAVSGHQAMGLFAQDGAGSQFYLARVPTAAAGQTLQVGFFDIGDCQGTLCHIQIVQPDGTPAGTCIGSGPVSGSLGSCDFDIPSSTFNGRWQKLFISIPTTYSCNDADQTACWYSVRYTAGTPTDVTAWQASINGTPVRLVN